MAETAHEGEHAWGTPCDVCHVAVPSFELWQHVLPDGSLTYGHRHCVEGAQNDGSGAVTREGV